MGLFSKRISNEEFAAKEENQRILEDFHMTKAWGVKKTQIAMQFIYDEDMKAFVVVEGPAETFKERNPYVIRFDQVEDIWLEVKEWWTEDGNKFNKYQSYKVLPIDKFDEVFWHYDLYLNIVTTHPFAGIIRYRMNYNTNILKIPGFHILIKRGLELNGAFRGQEIKREYQRLEEYAETLKVNLKDEKIFDIITRHNRDKGFWEQWKDELTADWYVSRVENVAAHVKRAYRISWLLGKSKCDEE